jgi:flagellar hook-length control protein FliK
MRSEGASLGNAERFESLNEEQKHDAFGSHEHNPQTGVDVNAVWQAPESIRGHRATLSHQTDPAAAARAVTNPRGNVNGAVADSSSLIGPEAMATGAIRQADIGGPVEGFDTSANTNLRGKIAADTEPKLPGAQAGDRGMGDTAPPMSNNRSGRAHPGVSHSFARPGMSPLTGRTHDLGAAHHSASGTQARMDSTVALQNEIARALTTQFASTNLSHYSTGMVGSSFDRRSVERFSGESSISKSLAGAELTISTRASGGESVSGVGLGTGVALGLGSGLIPGIAGRLADSLDEVSDRLSHSNGASRAFDGMTASGAAASNLPASTSAAAVTISQPLGSPDWSGAFAHAVTQVAASELTEATLTLSPPELGAIEIELELDGEDMHIAFMSDNADVRSSVESGLPALAQLLEKQGLSLGSADVRSNQGSDRGSAGDERSASMASSAPSRRGSGVSDPVTGEPTQGASRVQPRVADGRVDLYA